MAFASMVIVFLFVIAAVFVILILSGIILTIVSALRRRRAVREGKQPHKAGLIAGIILTLLPIALIGVIGIWLSHTPKDSPYQKSISNRDTLADGLTNGSAETILSAFSPSEQAAEASLTEEINGMLTMFGGSISGYQQMFPNEIDDKYNENGMPVIAHFSGELVDGAAASGETYTVRYYGYNRYEGHPEQLGLTYIEVYSDRGVIYSFGDKPE